MQLFIEWGSNLKVLQFLPSAYVQIMIKTKWKDTSYFCQLLQQNNLT